MRAREDPQLRKSMDGDSRSGGEEIEVEKEVEIIVGEEEVPRRDGVCHCHCRRKCRR